LIDAYDEVRYSSFPRNQSHPACISALARLAGLLLPPIERWRVLEIGCGDGTNILPLASDYPEGSFVGIDRAKETLEEGRTLAVDLQLKNLDLYATDLLEWQPEGEFDYIIAHGVYSWVPPEVRKRMLEICGKHLKPQGIAYISYNALPGCHFRRFARDLLRFHVRRHEDPEARIRKAHEMARLISSLPGEEQPQPAIRKEMETILNRDGTALYHDDLAETNEPFYFLDFISQAAQHGLQYLGDAEPQRDDVQGHPPLTEDWLESRQYGDFLAVRRFRETLLCRKDLPLDRKLVLDRFRDLYAASRARPEEMGGDGQQRFTLPKSGSVTTNHPFAKDLLGRLSAIWPNSMLLSEFPLETFPAHVVSELLMRLLLAEALELRASPPRIAGSVSEYPVASALVRAQVARGIRMVTTQRHQSLEFGDEMGRRFLPLLDGSRNHADLLRELAVFAPGQEVSERGVEAGLREFHRLSLLVG
jgi:SAM-dependent methyltransferase